MKLQGGMEENTSVLPNEGIVQKENRKNELVARPDPAGFPPPGRGPGTY